MSVAKSDMIDVVGYEIYEKFNATLIMSGHRTKEVNLVDMLNENLKLDTTNIEFNCKFEDELTVVGQGCSETIFDIKRKDKNE